ncbi:MAG TPA: GspE/PulE family protein, partial [Oxalicibacterium sp.]|uniref:GspE/PulE family protein n=1 Tax=Oxalicibacterium sp. TaxID=2766525 RepID=UPI002CBDB675
MNAPDNLFAMEASMFEAARSEYQRSGRDPLQMLETLSGFSSREVLKRLGTQFNWQVLETVEMLTLQPAFDLLPLAKCIAKKTVLLRDTDNSTVAVIDNPFDSDRLIWLESQAKQHVQVRLALASDIQAYLDKQEIGAKAIDTILDQQASINPEEKQSTLLSFSTVNDGASPAVKLVNSTLYDALKAGASDIHFESTPSGMTTKYRIDGVLNLAAAIHGSELAEQAISRLKVLAELDIAERRTPQDGSFRVQANGRDIDLRVSIMPSIHGEDAVIRILDKRAMIEAYGSLTLQALGFDVESLVELRALAEAAHGMLLVTGPTGSGKTTTLYAAISETNNGRDKIITIEDPVEYQLPGVLQIPVNDKKGLTFARGLRSILRHDPDKIMVGEIRDAETAE